MNNNRDTNAPRSISEPIYHGTASTGNSEMDEINRLARLCEAKDADNKLLRALHKKFIGSNKVLAEKLSDTQAQIEKLEPLRGEVAMLREALAELKSAAWLVPVQQLMYRGNMVVRKSNDALSDTQATALAYEREVENRGAVKALEELLDEADDSNWRNAAYSRIEELRASKGELK